MKLKCLLFGHDYKTNNITLPDKQVIGEDLWGRKMEPPMIVETVIIGKCKCTRCGKKFQPSWAVKDDKD